MTLEPGTHRLGPHNATLAVHTGRAGKAAKAGHDLVIHATSWSGSLELGDDSNATAVELTADATSLRVQEGRGGVKPLSDGDRSSIQTTIDDEVLGRRPITFRSTRLEGTPGHGPVRVDGELTLAGATRPIGFDLTVTGNGAVSATAVVKQTDWGVKPYSALFGALKVADEVKVVLDGRLGPAP